ncbi:hypothetical protein VTJ04DRAFT_5278 [Mycothermus thermophilus]|uniref:uncharacterized protein n=1 Tax=Humicola insolens TaxID=85995 RepID=UPI0037446959
MTTDPLSPSAVLETAAKALPTHEKDDTTSDVSSSLDAIALFVHACMLNLGFRLLGFDEERKIEAECARLAPRLPPQWNTSLNSHSFVYAHTQSAMNFVVHVSRMGPKTEIRALATGADRIARFDITARDYISPSALPLRITLAQDGSEDRSDLPDKLKTLFISPERIQDLASLLKINIIQRIIPGLHKEGYVEEPPTTRPEPQPQPPQQPIPRPGQGDEGPIPHLPPPAAPNPYPAPDPLAAPRPNPVPAADFPPPGFEDEYEINRPPRGPVPGSGAPPGGGGFGNLGRDDLYPAGLGPHDPIVGSFVPPPAGTGGGGGILGPEGLRRPGAGGFYGGGGGLGGQGPGFRGGGGMHPTFDDPLFGGPRGGGDDTFGGQVPPGARWDPLGPFGGPGPRFGGRGGRGGGNNNGFGGFGGGDII